MRRIIKALERKHPGHEVIDIRFSLAQGIDELVITEKMDAEIAKAIRKAKPRDISELA
jgi:hypothetical protein